MFDIEQIFWLDSKTTFVTVNQLITLFIMSGFANSKTTFVTVNPAT